MAMPLTNGGHDAPALPGGHLDERLWDAVFRSPSVLGRLIAVAELRDAGTGMYKHALAVEWGTGPVDQTLRRMHFQTFRSWLVLRLEQQECDISVWLAWMERNRADGAVRLRELARCPELLLPGRCLDMERELFLSDFGLAVSLWEQPHPRMGTRGDSRPVATSPWRRMAGRLRLG